MIANELELCVSGHGSSGRLDRAYVRGPGKVPLASIANSNLAIHQGKDHGGVNRYLQIPLELSRAAALIKDRIIPGLAPYVKP